MTKLKSLKEVLDEISSHPVPVEWFYKRKGEWYGTFKVGEIEYDASFTREDLKFDLPFKVVSFKFANPKQKDPYAFSFEFNQPLVVKNTIIKEIRQYILDNEIDVFIVKAYTAEQTRVSRYRKFTASLVRDFGFIFQKEITEGSYTYFCLFRSKDSYQESEQIIKLLK